MSDQPQSHPYTCGTCQVAFRTSPHQRTHMQSDWHRYNLKRRVASLPPLTSEVFNEKVLANQATAAATAARASFEKVCAACERTYYSENAYTNHLSSKKHRERLASLGDHTETESVKSSAFSLGASSTERESEASGDEGVNDAIEGLRRAKLAQQAEDGAVSEDENDEDDASTTAGDNSAEIPLTCLFCNSLSGNMQDNVKHMQRNHGMFIPEQKYLTDLNGLLEYLHEQVHDLHECLLCGARKYTSPGIQTHMRDKGHCMIAFDTEAQMIEIGQFYDFTSTYSDDEEEDDDDEESPQRAGGVRLGGLRKEIVETSDDDEEGEEWEDDDSEDAFSDDSTDAAQKSGLSTKKSKARTQPAYYDESGLHLPSGRTVGHRQFSRIWRQNLRNHPTPEERAARLAITDDTREQSPGKETRDQNGGRRDSQGQLIRSLGRQRGGLSRTGDGLGMLGLDDQQKRDAREKSWKAQRTAQREMWKYQLRVQRRQNNQKHFRDPLLQ